MKKIIFFIAFAFISIACFSQDIISMRRGGKMEVYITEITPTLIRYKLSKDPSARVYFVFKDDVSGIMYQNGRVQKFDNSEDQTVERKSSSNDNQSQYQNQNQNQEQNQNQYQRQRPNQNQYQRPNPYDRNQDDFETKSQSISRRNQTNDFTLMDGKGETVVYLKNGSIIKGTVIEQVPNKSIKLKTADGNIFVCQMDDIEKITRGTVVDNNTNSNYTVIDDNNYNDNDESDQSSSGLSPGYRGSINLGYFFGVGDYAKDRFIFNFINGGQISPFFSLGFGTGVHYYIDDEQVLIPFFMDFKFNFIDKPISPYFSFDIGYSFNATDDFNGEGVFANFSCGAGFKISSRNEIFIGLCYQIQNIREYYNENNWWDPSSSQINLGALAFRFGFSF